MTPDERRQQLIEESRQRHFNRGRLDVATNYGTFRLSATDSAHERDMVGVPRWESTLEIATGPTFMNGRLDDRALLLVADMIYRYLERPLPPVRVDVQLNPPVARRRTVKK